MSKATFADITDQANPISLGGNLNLQMTMTDGKGGPSDRLAITLTNSAGAVLFSSHWSGVQTLQQDLNGGNLVVR